MFQRFLNWIKSLFHVEQPVDTVDNTPQSNPDAPWMKLVIQDLGQPCVTGGHATDFNKKMFSYVDDDDLSDGIMKSGCAAGMSMVLEQSGYKSTRSSNAKNQLRLGTSIDIPRYGAPTIFQHADGSWHVSFYVSTYSDKKTGYFCGFNQSHTVKYSDYPLSEVMGYRWPVKR